MKTDRPKALMRFYTIEQIAECVDASTRTVRRWIQEGLLVAHRINGLVRISEADFQAFLTTCSGMCRLQFRWSWRRSRRGLAPSIRSPSA
jgi:excisionase family DNA binding protein